MFKRHYPKNSKYFLEILLHFLNLQKIQQVLQKKDQLHSLNISKVIYSDKGGYLNVQKLLFQNTFGESTVYGLKTLLKLALHHFHGYFPLSQDKLSQKISLLVRCQILGPFGNTLTTDHMYSRHHREKFPQHVQMPLPQKS